MKKIKLATELEQSLLRAVSLGLTSPSTLDPEDLSKIGRSVFKATNHLLNNGASVPLTSSAIYLTSKKIFGGDKKELTKYLHHLEKIELGDDAAAVIKTIRDKDVLVQIVNEAGVQLKDGTPNFLRFSALLEDRQEIGGGRKIKSLGEMIGGEWPEPPHGPRIQSLPKISKASNGICGIWALGGGIRE